MKIFKISTAFLCAGFALAIVIAAAMIIKQNMTDIMTNDDVSFMAHNIKYKEPVMTETAITEEFLLKKENGKISALTSNSFYKELKKQFPDYVIAKYKNLKNSEVIEKIYESLSNGMPAIISYAAAVPGKQNESEWTIYYGAVIGIDLADDKITVKNNPYGYIETYTAKEFLRATRFESYENMDFYLKLKFAAEIFTKNTVYIIETK